MQWWWLLLLFIMPFTGGLLGLRLSRENVRELKIFLAFGGSFLISITILNLIPEVYGEMGHKAGYYVLGGFFLQIITDYFSKGIEHGHLHFHEFEKRFPLSVFLALALHACLEGVGLGGEVFSRSSQLNLLYAIGLHEMPAAFALVLILKSGKNRKNQATIMWLIVYACMVPVGILIGHQLKEMQELLHTIMAVVIGVFLHISTTILFENTESHKYSKYKLVAIAVGLILALVAMNVHMH